MYMCIILSILYTDSQSIQRLKADNTD